MVVSDELMAIDDALAREVGQDALPERVDRADVERRAVGRAHLDIEAHAIATHDVVVPAHPIERERAVGEVHPVHTRRTLAVEAEVEHEHLVRGERRCVVRDACRTRERGERGRAHERTVVDGPSGGGRDPRREIDRDHTLVARHDVGRQIVQQRVHVLHGATRGIRERRVVAAVGRARAHRRDDVADVRVRKEPPHRIGVERVEVGRVELLVVRPQKLVGDALAEPAIEHLAERARGLLAGRPEVELVQALDELGLRQLVDVLLEREVDVAARIADRRQLRDRPDVLARHARAQPRLDRGILEVEEVARIVPHEPGALDGAAVPTGLRRRLHHQHARLGPARTGEVRESEARHAGPDHEEIDGGVRERRSRSDHAQPSERRTSSLWKMRRAIALAQPYVLSIPK